MSWNRRSVIGAGAALAALPLTDAVAAGARTGSFPQGFLWGAATSGHQIEGNNVNADLWVAENDSAWNGHASNPSRACSRLPCSITTRR
jgi:hypothetical protein